MSSTIYKMSLKNDWNTDQDIMNAWVCHVTDGKYNGFYVNTLAHGATSAAVDCEVVSGEGDYWSVFFIDNTNTLWGIENKEITLPYGKDPETLIKVVVDVADQAVQVYFGDDSRGSGTLVNLGVFKAPPPPPSSPSQAVAS